MLFETNTKLLKSSSQEYCQLESQGNTKGTTQLVITASNLSRGTTGNATEWWVPKQKWESHPKSLRWNGCPPVSGMSFERPRGFPRLPPGADVPACRPDGRPGIRSNVFLNYFISTRPWSSFQGQNHKSLSAMKSRGSGGQGGGATFFSCELHWLKTRLFEGYIAQLKGTVGTERRPGGYWLLRFVTWVVTRCLLCGPALKTQSAAALSVRTWSPRTGPEFGIEAASMSPENQLRKRQETNMRRERQCWNKTKHNMFFILIS